jgi:hypothetical protein
VRKPDPDRHSELSAGRSTAGDNVHPDTSSEPAIGQVGVETRAATRGGSAEAR